MQSFESSFRQAQSEFAEENRRYLNVFASDTSNWQAQFEQQKTYCQDFDMAALDTVWEQHVSQYQQRQGISPEQRDKNDQFLLEQAWNESTVESSVSKPGQITPQEMANSANDFLVKTSHHLGQVESLKKSRFVEWMKQIRDGQLVLQGQDIVEKTFDNLMLDVPKDF